MLIYPTEECLRLWFHKHSSLWQFWLGQVMLPPPRAVLGGPYTEVFVLCGGVAGARERAAASMGGHGL